MWICLKMSCTPNNGFADHYPVFKWLFHWEYTQHFQTNPCGFHEEHPDFSVVFLRFSGDISWDDELDIRPGERLQKANLKMAQSK